MSFALCVVHFRGTCYWVGKDSLRNWKKMALEQLNSSPAFSNSNGDDQDVEEPSGNGNHADSAETIPTEKGESPSQSAEVTSSVEEPSSGSISQPESKELTETSLNDESAGPSKGGAEEVSQQSGGKSPPVPQEDDSFSFNEDLLCEEHGEFDGFLGALVA